MSCTVVIKQEETEVDVDVDTLNITSKRTYEQVGFYDTTSKKTKNTLPPEIPIWTLDIG